MNKMKNWLKGICLIVFWITCLPLIILIDVVQWIGGVEIGTMERFYRKYLKNE